MRILLFLVLTLSSCTFNTYNACRPMQVGMVWKETETLRSTLEPGVYEKEQVYTEVYTNSDYKYTTTYVKLGDL